MPLATDMSLIHHALTERVIGIYYDVYAELGQGFLEKLCQQAMVIALREAGLSVREHVSFPVMFRGRLLGDFIADIVVNDLLLLEIKATSALHPWHEAQALN